MKADVRAQAASGARRVGGLRLWVPALGLVAAAAWAAGGMQHRIRASGFRRVEPAYSRLDAGRTWVDPRWEDELRLRLAAHASFEVTDDAARRAIADELARLSFVDAVGEPEVIWPDGLRVPVRLRYAVACASVRDAYLPVARDGTLLSGSWPTPPRVGPGWLPVIGPVDGSLDALEPGDRLAEPVQVDALAVAVSLWEHLDADALATLGRVAIDASRGRRTSVTEPGCVLLLEDGRRIWFGRPPDTVEPGSLPAEHKWHSVASALALLRRLRAGAEGGFDWALVDVRWDRPELLPRLEDEPEGEP